MSIALHRCTAADADLTARWLVKQYGFEPEEVAKWPRGSNISISTGR